MPDPVTAAPSAPAPVAARPAGTALGKDAFLKLLVAQLRYQDPMKPASGTEFLTQSAQFTMVERLEELSRNAADSVALERNRLAATLVGRVVTAAAADGSPVSGEVTRVRLGADGPTLVVGGRDVPLSTVREVSSQSAA